MDDVAHSLGMSKRTIYENFDDKLQLLKACLKHHSCAKQKEVYEQWQLSVVEHLHRVLKTARANMVEHDREFRFFQEIKKYYPTLHREVVEDALEKNVKFVNTYIEKGKSEGIFSEEINAEVAANILMAQMDTLTLSDRFSTFADMAGLMRHVFVIFFRGISTPKGIAEVDAMLKQMEEELK